MKNKIYIGPILRLNNPIIKKDTLVYGCQQCKKIVYHPDIDHKFCMKCGTALNNFSMGHDVRRYELDIATLTDNFFLSVQQNIVIDTFNPSDQYEFLISNREGVGCSFEPGCDTDIIIRLDFYNNSYFPIGFDEYIKKLETIISKENIEVFTGIISYTL